MEAVEPIKGSQESMVLEMYLQKQPKAVPEPMPEGANLCVGIPYFKGKSPFTYNYLPPKGQRHLKRVISNRFKLQLWDEIHTIETLVGEQQETITLWMENHGIAFSDKNWNAVAKIYQRMRGVYRLRGTRAVSGGGALGLRRAEVPEVGVEGAEVALVTESVLVGGELDGIGTAGAHSG